MNLGVMTYKEWSENIVEYMKKSMPNEFEAVVLDEDVIKNNLDVLGYTLTPVGMLNDSQIYTTSVECEQDDKGNVSRIMFKSPEEAMNAIKEPVVLQAILKTKKGYCIRKAKLGLNNE